VTESEAHDRKYDLYVLIQLVIYEVGNQSSPRLLYLRTKYRLPCLVEEEEAIAIERW
jgi:hypothetical protein